MSNVIPQKVVVVPNLATFQSTGIAGYQGSQAQIAYLQGTVTEFDGGQGFYQLADNNFSTPSNPPTVIVDGAGNRWMSANVTLTAAAIIALLTGTPLPVVAGGTGQATASAALDALTVQGANIAAAATTDLATATGEFVVVTGNGGPITALGTAPAGIWRFVRFTGTPTLTHNGTSLILPGAANITVAAGDTACFMSLGSGNWQCLFYTEIAGGTVGTLPIAQGGTGQTTAPAAFDAVSGNLGARMLFRLTAADMNTTADQVFTKLGTFSSYSILNPAFRIDNASTSLTTAVGGVYTAAGKSGITIVSAAQVYSGATGPGLGFNIGATAAGLSVRTETPILSLTTPQGAPATLDFYVFGIPLS